MYKNEAEELAADGAYPHQWPGLQAAESREVTRLPASVTLVTHWRNITHVLLIHEWKKYFQNWNNNNIIW